jgi:hypothetical protein
VTGVLTGEQFGQMFTSFSATARRLESRERYDVTGYRAALRQFLDGCGFEVPPRFDTWQTTVRTAVAADRSVQRVRVVGEPLNGYQRFSLRLCRHNVEAGEDVRYLGRSAANQLDIPDHDFWVFDTAVVVVLRFTGDDRPLDAESVTEAGIVARHVRWLDLATAAATPYADFLAAEPERQQPLPESRG